MSSQSRSDMAYSQKNAAHAVSIEDVSVKQIYFVPHPTRLWVKVLVERVDLKKGRCHVRDVEENAELDLDPRQVPFLPVNSSTSEDLTSLYHLHEPGIIDNLEQRADLRDQRPYTRIANVLISVNPLRRLPECQQDLSGEALGRSKPHPWATAETALRQLRLGTKSSNQSIVISGESGAGKTESAKEILAYLCKTGSGGKRSVEGLDRQLLDSNPILEALGNAKTSRNDNSSRFGKFMKLQFAKKVEDFLLTGATIETYLLERSRVVEQTDGERNYHALYQLVAGSSVGEASQLMLQRFKTVDFNYLNASSCASIDDVDDAYKFSQLRSAFYNVGLGDDDDDDDQDSSSQQKKERQRRRVQKFFEAVTRVLAAVLHLGNITFDAAESVGSGDRASVVSETDGAARPALNAVVSTLGVATDRLEDLLTKHRIQAPGLGGSKNPSYYTKEHDATMAALTRDAVAKEVYSRMFDAVVAGLASSMATPQKEDCFIGVLDIFGFESFARNDLEQLFINFANESLQATFNRAVLVAEHDLYVAEGIVAPEEKEKLSAFEDSTAACVALIAGRKSFSIFRILDEFSKTAKLVEEKPITGNKRVSEIEERFCRDLHSKLKNSDRFVTPPKKDILDTFIVAHYAADVKYSVGRFIAKNANEIPGGLDELLAESGVFESLTLSKNKKKDDDDDDDDEFSRNKKKKSVSAVFTSQMNSLCELLDSTSCSFVRCIKPNSSMRMGVFEREFVAKQLRAQGILQTCDVLKLGMPTRVRYEEIETRYRATAQTLLAKKMANPLAGFDARDFTAAVLWSLGIGSDAYSMGKTRVFFRTGKISLLDRLFAIDLEEEDGFVSRLRYYQSRKIWRRSLARVWTALALKERWERGARQRRAVLTLQIRYRYYRAHGTGRARRLNRKRWRIAYLKVRCLLYFLDDFRLIHETRLNRERLEREAAASVMEIKVAKRSVSTILSEAVARGQVSKSVGDNALEKMREREQAMTDRELEDFEEYDDEIDDDDIVVDGESRALSRVSVEDAQQQESVENLLSDAAAAFEDKPDLDQKVAAEVRKAMARLKLAKSTLKRWMRVLLHRGWEKWRAVAKSPRTGTPVVKKKKSIGVEEDVSDDDDDGTTTAEEEGDSSVADAWLKADIRRAINELRNVLAKAPKLKDATDELNDEGLAKLLDPTKMEKLPTEDDEIWESIFRPAGTGASKAIAAAAAPPTQPPAPAPERAESPPAAAVEPEEENAAVNTLQQQIALLKKQLSAAGVQAVDLIPLAEAREKMNAAVRRLMDGDMEAEKEVEKYDQIIRMHPDYEKEEAEKAEKWVRDTKPKNLEAQSEMRRLVPHDIRSASLADLSEKGLPQSLVRRLWTKKATWLVRFHPDDTAKLHIADLLSKYNNQGLDIVEMRAVWASLPEEFENDGDGKKSQWKANFRTKLMELVNKEEQNRLSKGEKRNPGYKDVDPNGYFDPRTPLVRAGITKSNPYAAQEKPVIKVAAAARSQFTTKEKKISEKPKMSGEIERQGTVPGPGGMIVALSKAKKFVVLVNGELKGYSRESEFTLDKPPEFTFPLRGEDAVKLVDPLTLTRDDGVRLVLASESTETAWRNAISEELGTKNPKEKMKQLKEMKMKADQQKGPPVASPSKGGLMAAISGRGRGAVRSPSGRNVLDGVKSRGRASPSGRGAGRGSPARSGNAPPPSQRRPAPGPPGRSGEAAPAPSRRPAPSPSSSRGGDAQAPSRRPAPPPPPPSSEEIGTTRSTSPTRRPPPPPPPALRGGGGTPMSMAAASRGRGLTRGASSGGGLMDAIASRGRGGRALSRGMSRGRGIGGGSLMDAIAAKRKPPPPPPSQT